MCTVCAKLHRKCNQMARVGVDSGLWYFIKSFTNTSCIRKIIRLLYEHLESMDLQIYRVHSTISPKTILPWMDYTVRRRCRPSRHRPVYCKNLIKTYLETRKVYSLPRTCSANHTMSSNDGLKQYNKYIESVGRQTEREATYGKTETNMGK